MLRFFSIVGTNCALKFFNITGKIVDLGFSVLLEKLGA